jgi:ABC-2 type transport system ATP-binding protein
MPATYKYELGSRRPRGERDQAPAAIETITLERRFGRTEALGGLDLRVGEGEVYGLLGPNGAGKSTLIRILCTLLLPSAGTARVAGHDVAREPQAVRRRIGVALQAAALDELQTGRELLELQARLYGLRRSERRRRLSEVLDLVHVGAAIDRRIGGYSGGMKRRIDLAAALVHAPEVLFLDEPTTGLDPESRAEVWNEVRRLNTELGLTVFLTTQYLEEADALADRIGVIAGGHLVAEGSPAVLKRLVVDDLIVVEADGHDPLPVDAVRALAHVTDVAVDGAGLAVRTTDATATLLPLSGALARAGLHVRSLHLRTPTLDDVYRHLVGAPSDPTAVSP